MYLTKRLRFLIRFVSAVIKKQFRLVFLGLSLGVIFYQLFPKIVFYLPKPQKTIKTGLVGQYSVDNLPETVLDDVSYGLTKINNKGEIEPALAESWTISDDLRTYIFKISKNNIIWHDRKTFNIKDINYNFKDISYSFDDDSISFLLKEPFAPLPSILSRPLFRKGLIGLGDYKIKKIVKKGKYVQSILLVPFADSILPNKLYRFYKSENELKTGFNLGEINEINEVFSSEGISPGKSVRIFPAVKKNIFLGLFFNTNNPFLSDKTFRQSLAYAIPKETGEKRSTGPINPENWSYNPDVKPYKQDIEKAKSLLEQNKVDSKIKIVISALPQYRAMAEVIKSSWGLLGIESEIKIVSFVPEEFEVLLIAREIPKDPDQYYFWHSTQPGNLSNFKSPRIDKLLEDGRITNNVEERKSLYFDFQRYLVEETPVVFLTHPTMSRVVRD